MEEAKRFDAILLATPWRCFHCDFITSDPAEAAAHFGDRDDAEEFKPICRWWDRVADDAEKISAYQTMVMDAHQREDEIGRQRVAIEGLECQIGTNETEIRGFKPFRGCSSIYEVFCLYDSMVGRALAAEERLRGLQEQSTNN